MKENYYFGTCHICGNGIDIPGHDRYHCSHCRKWLPHPKNHDREPKSLNPDKPVHVFRLPKSQLTLDLQGGEP